MKASRIGLGTDVHVLVPDRRCVLGGIEFDCPVGPVSWSDGDAVLHALTDALLGAAGLPDLGTLFPDDDERFKDADSTDFVAQAVTELRAKELTVLSTDIVVHCDRPKIGPRREEVRASIAGLLGVDVDCVNVKGKTLEHAGGERETVSAMAIVLLGPRLIDD
ncbi:MAG: 2-C-methyl-D-erythritol 2,4-cyclodiphosphate synthase [Planctomycetota bacterium]|nr:2-C-methyl-D-erythritol 2,4-cyclodiphosphate synthase [Planctomycetota bacterium]